MSSCVGNILTKNYQNLIIGFRVTVKNVGNVFLRHGVYQPSADILCAFCLELRKHNPDFDFYVLK